MFFTRRKDPPAARPPARFTPRVESKAGTKDKANETKNTKGTGSKSKVKGSATGTGSKSKAASQEGVKNPTAATAASNTGTNSASKHAAPAKNPTAATAASNTGTNSASKNARFSRAMYPARRPRPLNPFR